MCDTGGRPSALSCCRCQYRFWRCVHPVVIAAITEVPVASLLLRDVNSYTLAVGMQQYLNPQNYLWGDFAAAAVMSALPITIVFLLAQRWLVNGLTAGGVKG
ncbi:maltose transporter permease [Escherichia coli]|nr:maltose transporter permease [Escherichia coli]